MWADLPRRYRIAAGIVSLFALTPLFLLVFTHDVLPLWEQMVALAVFTPMTFIGEWIVITGRITIRRRRPDA